MRAAPDDGDPVLVVGAGVLGLAMVASLKGLFPGCPVTVLARHAHQADAAAACGADHVVRSDAKGGHFEELARLTGSRIVGRKADVMLMGGFPYVVEAVGAAQSVTDALRAVAHRGTVLLLGAAGVSEVDLTPIWYKEAALVGSIDHAVDAALRARAGGRTPPSLRRPGPRRPRRRAPPCRRRRDPRVRPRRLSRRRRDRRRPSQLARHQGGLPPFVTGARGAHWGGRPARPGQPFPGGEKAGWDQGRRPAGRSRQGG